MKIKIRSKLDKLEDKILDSDTIPLVVSVVATWIVLIIGAFTIDWLFIPDTPYYEGMLEDMLTIITAAVVVMYIIKITLLKTGEKEFDVIEEEKVTRKKVYEAIKESGDKPITFSELVDVFYKPPERTHELLTIIMALRSDTWITGNYYDGYTVKHRSQEPEISPNVTGEETNQI